jgi:lipopolysaccharide transport system ATP-binding protein
MPFNTPDAVLTVQGLSKAFALYAKPIDRLKEALTGKVHHARHQALADLSFTLHKGEALGLIGQNGAGKSTLLKIIAGVLQSDAGSVLIRGRIAGLLELGTGFDLEATGRQNIALNARLMGLTEDQIIQMTPQVVAFAELGPFIDMPVRSYSSGMVMRLGFAVAYHAQPAAFIVDEALSVGDARFQQKCRTKIVDFKAQGGALLFVSHDLSAVRFFCDRVLVLDKGQAVFDGSPDQAVQAYYRILSGSGTSKDDFTNMDLQDRAGYGHRQVRIQSVLWEPEQGPPTTIVCPEDSQCVQTPAPLLQVASGTRVAVSVRLVSDIAFKPSVGILIRDRFGQDVFGVNTALRHLDFDLDSGERVAVVFDLTLDLAPGPYTITLAVHTDVTHHDDCQHWWDNALSIEVAGFASQFFLGLVQIPHQIRIQRPTADQAQ